jgi:hypothetical protein
MHCSRREWNCGESTVMQLAAAVVAVELVVAVAVELVVAVVAVHVLLLMMLSEVTVQ